MNEEALRERVVESYIRGLLIELKLKQGVELNEVVHRILALTRASSEREYQKVVLGELAASVTNEQLARAKSQLVAVSVKIANLLRRSDC